MQQTSIAAYRSFNSSGNKIDHHRRILAALDFIGEGTFIQIANSTGLTYNQVGRRVSELVSKGLVYDTGRKGLSPGGNAATVWAKVENKAA